ncbi:SprT-like domain-containing protein [Sansalvadorimonas verongulae]|uniref:SprT-like domain-containing protein n=1 Tax=Sansalvadorimonas verongulae TaxID=2172824 RepID=UPI0012BC8EAA|nr:SprT-like domain-containing protein [Sansalvadorimonas verongulae]MTI13082.1 hypothetical protein [Sansalvadorimonas verongulae]
MIQKISQQLTPFLPAGTEALCARWLVDDNIHMRVSRPRKTKLGDFRPAASGRPHRISVNGDLEPVQFLITFAHEVAHVHTWNKYGRRASPHGKEWKANYRANLHALLALNVLDAITSEVLKSHSKNPAASSSTDSHLQSLRISTNSTTVNDLKAGDVFQIEKGKTFKAIRKLRKYWLCEEPATGRHYRVLGSLLVTLT